MNIIQTLQRDYQNFPHNQSYDIYDSQVYFQDPLQSFQGLVRYQKMIGFLDRWFKEIHLQLHHIEQQEDLITIQWTLSWCSPLPWKPQLTISGHSELKLNSQGLICSHIDYWQCSKWQVIRQHCPP